MKIIQKKINELVEYENNPRINDRAVEPVAESIKTFGFKQPIVIDKSNIIIAGHTRYKAALSLGLEKVPCLIADDLTEDQVKAYRLVDNKTAELAEWNFDLLLDELENIELDMSGFGDWELPELEEPLAEKETMPPAETEEELLNLIRDIDVISVQFSGGKDSVAVLNWAVTAAKSLDKPIEALFVETGAEYPCVTAHVVDVCNRLGVNLRILNPKKHILQHYATKKCFPNVLFRECMHEFIHETTDIYLASKNETFVLLRGGRKDQKTAKSKSTTVLEKTYKDKTFKIVSPFYAFSAEKYEAELEKVKDFMWSGYEKGFVRTACWMCPFQTDQQFKALEENYPVLWSKMKDYINEWEFTEVKGCQYRKRLHKHKETPVQETPKTRKVVKKRKKL